VSADRPLRGQLLIASPALRDSNFHRTVILVAEHGDEGAMGIVLNRPSEATVEEAVPSLVELVGSDAVVYVGGPVEPSAVVVLAEFGDPDDAATLVFAEIGFARADADPDLLTGSTRRARLFAGYAGWGAGQLEAELEEDAWIVEPPRPDDVFSDEPGSLWADVLRRKGGRYALVATMPPNPSLN
jgi:putative transcriptional regulator